MVKVPDTEENASACLCSNCPSKSDDGESFYCVKGKSPVSAGRGFCACRWCPLWSGYGLEKELYCESGAE